MRPEDLLPLTRRRFMLAASALGAGALAGLAPRIALAMPTLTLGEARLDVLSDGGLVLPLAFVLPEQSAEEIAALFAPHGMATDALRPDCNITLLRTGDRVVLFDAGAGANFQPTAGKLTANLEAAGIDPAEITDVVFTHGHPDHLWGVLDDFDEPVFGEARYWVPEAEWNYWRAEGTLDSTPEERKSFVVGAQARLAAIEERVTAVRPGAEVLPGVEAVATNGHTPGHMSYMLHGGGESVLVVGDAISNLVISFERPDWHSGTDHDRVAGAATRRALLDRLVADKARMIGFHLPYPGLGAVEAAGAGYRFVAMG
ncbi:MBL fold metallo-hydrolase [Polymorphum gilvum]|uniref:Metallo-beta-lactamase family protein n=1 Tax=Polymorphum gilvum (strain LMG 25793 / CGMCC 1.9160 / SL003B-26A1) TaxID=991905 RepID=F2J553_POLGS|nr:MBL fold metallo-hydrolase [Polymorphum gilvum]ADZ71112.1 Metallo-beta-lactamase family protein [Polymorphum gilvum SL003B-26A1]